MTDTRVLQWRCRKEWPGKMWGKDDQMICPPVWFDARNSHPDTHGCFSTVHAPSPPAPEVQTVEAAVLDCSKGKVQTVASAFLA